MGIKNIIKRAGGKAADKISDLSVLSENQLQDIENKRNQYLLEMPALDNEEAEEQTLRLLAAASVDIFNDYLNLLDKIYEPVEKDAEYEFAFDPGHNIRYINITKWVTDKKENSLEKLVNVYEVLSGEDCNIALVFHRMMSGTEVYLAVTNTDNAPDNVDVNNYKARLVQAIRGNFPGAEWKNEGSGVIPFMKEERGYSVAAASNIPGEKSEKFISQTIEKLLDGNIPDDNKKEYTIILLATPVQNVSDRKLHLAELYSGLAPYAGWQTTFQYSQSDSANSSATFGLNAGVSAGVQNGTNQSYSQGQAETNSENQSVSDSESETETETEGSSFSKTESVTDTDSESTTDTIGANINIGGRIAEKLGIGVGLQGSHGVSKGVSHAKSYAKTTAKSWAKSQAKTVGRTLTNGIGHAVTNSQTLTNGISKGVNLGGNFGANFARSSNVSATVGKNEGITQTFTNYTIKHTLEVLEDQMKRLEESSALGMWDFAAYVVSEDMNEASNVAHSYLALTQGEESYMSQTAVNVWRGDITENAAAKEIYAYLKELRHPLFGLKPALTDLAPIYNVYPSFVTAATALSGKELAYSLNFPQKSIVGLPVLECAEFGRNVVTYNSTADKEDIYIGRVFHMNHEERVPVTLGKNSLASHTFITGSTGSGKSNTVYQLLNEASENDVKFLVVEPAKGEYKHVFGNEEGVSVYGTNPYLSPMLRLNPFSFEDGVHVYEHLDRLIEIFNVCWPMYAAMPAVLKDAIEKSYEDCGWDMTRSVNVYGEKIFPTFADVAGNIKNIIDSSEYDTENKGAYKGSLLTRLQSLTNGINGTIFVSEEIPADKLFDENVIIDLSRVGSTETKSLIMGILVLKLQEYRMASDRGMNAGLKHVTVLEEAHNLLKRTSAAVSSESGNLAGKSVEMISNAIAEMRTYGEGFIIVDQAPGLLDMAAIRNTNTKIIMRLPDLEDRELVGRAANLNDDQVAELAKLPCGVGAVYQNEWVQPVLCKVERYSNPETGYQYVMPEDVFASIGTEDVSETLLDFILNNELFKNDEADPDYKELKDKVIHSKLAASVKTEFLKYLDSGEKNKMQELRSLLFDLMQADAAMDAAKQMNDLTSWAQAVVNALHPSLREYSNRQINIALGLLLYEQAERDSTYNDLYCRFTEVYRNEGRVF